MKGILCMALGLLAFAMAARGQQAAGDGDRFTSVLVKGSGQRFAHLPVLEVFGQGGDAGAHFGFRMDSAIMTRDLAALLEGVTLLAALEDSAQTRSPHLSAATLMDTTAVIFVRHMAGPLKWAQYSAARALASRTGAGRAARLLAEAAPEYDAYLRLREEEARAKQVRSLAARESAPRAKNRLPPPAAAGTPGAKPAATAAPPANVPVLNIVNSSGKTLYIYLEDEYKGILYAGKSLPLRGLTGCWQLSVESLDQFKAVKKHCFGPAKTQQWIVTND